MTSLKANRNKQFSICDFPRRRFHDLIPSERMAVFTFSLCSGQDSQSSTLDARRLAADIDKRTCNTSRAIFVSYPQLNGVT